MRCLTCHSQIRHWSLEHITAPLLALEREVERRALLRLQMEGLDKDAKVAEPAGEFFNRPLEFAMHESGPPRRPSRSPPRRVVGSPSLLRQPLFLYLAARGHIKGRADLTSHRAQHA